MWTTTTVETVNGAEILRFVTRTSVKLTDGINRGRRAHYSRTIYIVRRPGQKDQESATLRAARALAEK